MRTYEVIILVGVVFPNFLDSGILKAELANHTLSEFFGIRKLLDLQM